MTLTFAPLALPHPSPQEREEAFTRLAGSWVVLLRLSLSFICYICPTWSPSVSKGEICPGKHSCSHPRGSVCPAVVLSVGQPRA